MIEIDLFGFFSKIFADFYHEGGQISNFYYNLDVVRLNILYHILLNLLNDNEGAK